MPSSRDRARLARDGIFNVRDLGGMPAAGGRSVARRKVLRADSLHRVSTSAEVLRGLGLVRVLDLRDDREREGDGVLALDDIEVQHHPVIDPTFAWYDDSPPDDETLLAQRYRQILSSFGSRFAAAVESVAEVVGDDRGAVAYHCAVGKDRTGLLTALLLDVVDVPDEVIVADYARSSAATAVQVSWLWSLQHPHGAATEDDIFVGMWSARPATMADTLGWIDTELGGAAQYLLDHGVDREVLDALRAALLVEGDRTGNPSPSQEGSADVGTR